MRNSLSRRHLYLAAACALILSGCGGAVQTAAPGAEGAAQEEGIVLRDEVSMNGVAQQETQESLETESEPETEEEPEARAPVRVKGIYVTGPAAGGKKLEELIGLVEETELNALVIDIKNDEGRITYDMDSQAAREIGACAGYVKDMRSLVKSCREKNIYLIARVVAFRDPFLAQAKPELSVKLKNGDVFYDKSGLAWVNPYKKEVWEYLMEIAKQAADVGFDEIQFDYIRFSTDLKTDRMDFGPEAEGKDKTQIITEFTEYAYDELSPLGVFVSADVFGTVIENKIDQDIVGQNYQEMARHLDYICPMVYPSHYGAGVYGLPVPDARPYDTVYAAMSASAEKLSLLPEESRAGGRAWLQSFTASWVPGHIKYGPQAIRDEIKGAYDAGCKEWILWNAANNYQRDSLLTDEEAKRQEEAWDMELMEQSGVSGNDGTAQ